MIKWKDGKPEFININYSEDDKQFILKLLEKRKREVDNFDFYKLKRKRDNKET